MGCLVLLALLVLVVTASIGVRRRRVEKVFAEATAVERVDFGVRLHVVRKEPLTGDELIPGKPRMRLVRTEHLGGMVEIRDGSAVYVGPSENPRIWFASELQARLVLHDDDLPLWLLVEGSEGAGKSTLLAQWHYARVAEHVGESVEGGLTAPTYARLGHVRKAIAELWDPRWYTWKERDQVYTFHVGPRVQLVSAVKRSEAGGSPIQGANWSWHGGDELQDHFEREADIEARGRSAKGGRYKRLNTATPKDLPAYRDFRAACATSKPDPITGEVAWMVVRMLGPESPFIHDAHWQRLRSAGTMTEREYNRRVRCMDVGPEKQVYFNWRRSFDNGKPANLAPIPAGAVDVTARELRAWGRNVTVLAGHDPGLRQHVTEFLKAFECPGDRAPRWFVVGEVTSPEATIHGHIQVVKEYAGKRWGCIPVPDRFGNVDANAATMIVRIDPATQSGEDHPGEDVFRAWRVAGVVAKPAQYAPNSTKGTPLKKRQRIDLLNTLLSATAGVGEVRRLFVALLDDDGRLIVARGDSPVNGKPAAPALVKAFETMETNAAGKAEAERKDADDMSHWPAATAFALWLIESRRLKWEPEERAA